MKKITITVVRYNELDEKTREKIKCSHWFYDYMQDIYNLMSQDTIDIWKEKLETLGFENAVIHYNGFYCQGDGACFTADHKHGRVVTPFRGTFPDAMEFDPDCYDWGDPIISGEKQEKILHFAKCQAQKIYEDLEEDNNTVFANDEFISNTFNEDGIMFSLTGVPFIYNRDKELETDNYFPLLR